MSQMLFGNDGRSETITTIDMGSDLCKDLQKKVIAKIKPILNRNNPEKDRSFVYIASYKTGRESGQVLGYNKCLSNDVRNGDYAHYFMLPERARISAEELNQVKFLSDEGYSRFITFSQLENCETFIVSTHTFGEQVPISVKKAIVESLLEMFGRIPKKALTSVIMAEKDLNVFSEKSIALLVEILQYLPYEMRRKIAFLSHVETGSMFPRLINFACFDSNCDKKPIDGIDLAVEMDRKSGVFSDFVEFIFSMPLNEREAYFEKLKKEIEQPAKEAEKEVCADFYLYDLQARFIWDKEPLEDVLDEWMGQVSELKIYPAFTLLIRERLQEEEAAYQAILKKRFHECGSTGAFRDFYEASVLFLQTLDMPGIQLVRSEAVEQLTKLIRTAAMEEIGSLIELAAALHLDSAVIDDTEGKVKELIRSCRTLLELDQCGKLLTQMKLSPRSYKELLTKVAEDCMERSINEAAAKEGIPQKILFLMNMREEYRGTSDNARTESDLLIEEAFQNVLSRLRRNETEERRKINLKNIEEAWGRISGSDKIEILLDGWRMLADMSAPELKDVAREAEMFYEQTEQAFYFLMHRSMDVLTGDRAVKEFYREAVKRNQAILDKGQLAGCRFDGELNDYLRKSMEFLLLLYTPKNKVEDIIFELDERIRRDGNRNRKEDKELVEFMEESVISWLRTNKKEIKVQDLEKARKKAKKQYRELHFDTEAFVNKLLRFSQKDRAKPLWKLWTK